MERFGLLTIIVPGEVIVGVVRGVAGQPHLSWLVGGTAALVMLVAIGLWWVFFDAVSHHLPRPGNLTVSGWMYLHLPMTMGIAAVGAAIVNVVEGAGEPLPAEVRWLLVGATAVVLVSIALLVRTIQVAPELGRMHRRAGRVLLLSSLVTLLVGLTNLGAIPLLVLLVLLMLAPVFYGVKTWVEVTGAGASAPM